MALPTGKVGWIDLTVDDAPRLRDFYASVVGWTVEPLSMGDYDDYVMKDETGEAAAGVVHRRGPNANVLPVWIPYFVVADLAASVAKIVEGGGTLLNEPTKKVVYFKDPAGAVAAIGRWEEPTGT